MRALEAMVVVCVFGVLAGCFEARSPARPSDPPLETPSTFVPTPIPAPPPPASASLAIEQLSVEVSPGEHAGWFNYLPRFQLRETSGVSGAIIQDVWASTVDEGASTGPGCWRENIRVPPGGRVDVFFTDEGAKWLGYCGLWTGARTATRVLTVLVNFTDDEGRKGGVRATVSP